MSTEPENRSAGLARRLVTVLLLAFVGVAVAFLIVREAGGGTEETEQVSARVMVYYFHGNYRCPTCNTIERLTHEAVSERFDDLVEQGVVGVRSVNVDEPEYRHYSTRYELNLDMPRTVVVASFNEDGERTGFQHLMDVWDLFNRPAAFKDHIEEQVRANLPEDVEPAGEESAGVGA
jgi:hypothetical protein